LNSGLFAIKGDRVNAGARRLESVSEQLTTRIVRSGAIRRRSVWPGSNAAPTGTRRKCWAGWTMK